MYNTCPHICQPLLSTFSDDDRRACLPAVAFILRMAERARMEGILALEEIVNKEGESFGFILEVGTELIVGGTNPEYVKGILETFTASSAVVNNGQHSVDTLRRMVITEGLLSVQAGEDPNIIRIKMLSLLGEHFYKEACSYLGTKHNPNERVDNYLNKLPESGKKKPLDDLLERISNRDFQLLLREMDQYTLVKAMQDLTKASQKRIFENLSMRLGSFIVIDVEACHALESDIEQAQRDIIALYDKLCKQV